MSLMELPFVSEPALDELQLDADLDLFASLDMGYGSSTVDMKTDLMYDLVEEQCGADHPASTDMLDLPKFLEGISFPDCQHETKGPKRSIPTEEVVVGQSEEALTAVVSDMEDLSHCSSDDELRSTASLHESDVRNKRRKLATSYPADVHQEFLNNQIQIAYYNLQQSMKRSESSRRQLVKFASGNEALKKGTYFTSSSVASKTPKSATKAKNSRSKAKASNARSKARRATTGSRSKKTTSPSKPEQITSYPLPSAAQPVLEAAAKPSVAVKSEEGQVSTPSVQSSAQ